MPTTKFVYNSKIMWSNTNKLQVALKTFVDNVSKQVVERHLLRPLPNLFSPETVAAYTDEDLSRVAAESEQAKVKRGYLLDLHKGLMESLAELNHC
jgi:hypothetical protein